MVNDRPSASPAESAPAQRPKRGRYPSFVAASFGHAMTAMLRQQRLILAAAIVFLPVLLPLAMAFLSRSRYADEGLKAFERLADYLYINTLSPLLALFFAIMLVAGEVEAQTIPYMLTRPMPRSAWVLGRFLAYMAVSFTILALSLLLTFAACATLDDFPINASNLKLMLHFDAVIAMSLLAYGALAIFLGAVTRHPVVVGVLLIYAWQPMATLAKGLIDFFTISKYLEELMPTLVSGRGDETIRSALLEFQRQIFVVGATKAAITLAIIAAIFLVLTIVTVRARQYASAHAIGA